MHNGHQKCSAACRKLLGDLVLVENTDCTTVVQYLAVKVSQAAFKQMVIQSTLGLQLLMHVTLMYKLF